MAYIESHQSLLSHPKTRRLARALNMPAVHVMGHLHALWHWALDYAQDGDLSRFEATDIADAAAWEGDPDTWLSALVECGVGGGSGFLDLTAGGGMAIHDWPDYAGKLIDRRKANAERMRQARATHETPTPEPRAAHVQRTSETHADTCGANVTKLSVPKQNVTELSRAEQNDNARVREIGADAPIADKPHDMVVNFLERLDKDERDVAPAWMSEQRKHAQWLIEQGFAWKTVSLHLSYLGTQTWRTTPISSLAPLRKTILDWEAAGKPASDKARGSPNGKHASNVDIGMQSAKTIRDIVQGQTG